MAKTYEPITIESGETVWPVDSFHGLRYVSAVEAAILAKRESNQEVRAELVDRLYNLDDYSDEIGYYVG